MEYKVSGMAVFKHGIFKTKRTNFLLLLYGYHLCFVCLAYSLRVARGFSDAHFYWGQGTDLLVSSWFSYFGYGSNLLLFLNYPFVRFGFPFWFGFLLYGSVGFLGIWQWLRWVDLVFGKTFIVKGINILPLFFFLPNLHYWTASLGKEALVFWGIASVFYAFSSRNYFTLRGIAGFLIVLLLRPHVALMLLISFFVVLLFSKQISTRTRVLLGSIGIFIGFVSFYMVLQLSHIRYWNWERIQRFNDYSLMSFEKSGSYVPMLEYPYFYRLFSFSFRPLFYDASSVWLFFASIENAIVLFIHLLALFFVLKFYKTIDFALPMKVVFMFALVGSLLYVARYANLGIFMRTKMMFQPFVLVALLAIVRQGMTLNQSKL